MPAAAQFLRFSEAEMAARHAKAHAFMEEAELGAL